MERFYDLIEIHAGDASPVARWFQKNCPRVWASHENHGNAWISESHLARLPGHLAGDVEVVYRYEATPARFVQLLRGERRDWS